MKFTSEERGNIYTQSAIIHITKFEGTYHHVPPPISDLAPTLKERRKMFPELRLFDYDEKKENFCGLDGLLEQRNIEVTALLLCAEICNSEPC